MNTKIGDYRHRIEIQAPVRTSDGKGGFTTVYTTIATVWAKITPVASSERLEAKQLNSEITHRVNIRYRTKFNPSWRIKYGLRYFSIVGVMNVKEANAELQMVVKEAA